MKKEIFLGVGYLLIAAAVASAQTAGVSVNGSSSGVINILPAPGSAPVIFPLPTPDTGFIQFNNLVIESVSASSPPAEILAGYSYPIPLMGATSRASDSSNMSSAGQARVPAAAGQCYRFKSQNSNAGQSVHCPTPPSTNPSAVSTTPGMPSSPGVGGGTMPIYPRPYRIEVDSSTRLILRDRTDASLSDFSAGDKINIFGYYNNDGSIQAYLVRNLSKPMQQEFIQLNNAELISISATSTPVTLVVAQAQGYPCYGFGVGGNARAQIACPMGVNLPNVQAPSALLPNWMMMRKYVVSIDNQTVILDRARDKLNLSDLMVGDELNTYGDTTDSGQTIKADIIRDLSIPAQAATYSGKVIQVTSDGSFVIQTADGRSITVQNPIQTGLTVSVTGLLNRLTNILSNISSIIVNQGGVVGPGVPIPILRTNNTNTSPSKTPLP